jgi:hypothetical protein
MLQRMKQGLDYQTYSPCSARQCLRLIPYDYLLNEGWRLSLL